MVSLALWVDYEISAGRHVGDITGQGGDNEGASLQVLRRHRRTGTAKGPSRRALVVFFWRWLSFSVRLIIE